MVWKLRPQSVSRAFEAVRWTAQPLSLMKQFGPFRTLGPSAMLMGGWQEEGVKASRASRKDIRLRLPEPLQNLSESRLRLLCEALAVVQDSGLSEIPDVHRLRQQVVSTLPVMAGALASLGSSVSTSFPLVRCGSCEQPLAPQARFCHACGKLQPKRVTILTMAGRCWETSLTSSQTIAAALQVCSRPCNVARSMSHASGWLLVPGWPVIGVDCLCCVLLGIPDSRG